jgi:hypothetical protein
MNPRRVHELMTKHFPAFDGAELDWVNVHDGRAPKLTELDGLLHETFAEDEVLVAVTRKEGDFIPLSDAAAYIGQRMGSGNIRVSNRDFSSFMVVAQNCVASAWRMTDNKSAQHGRPTASAGLSR